MRIETINLVIYELSTMYPFAEKSPKEMELLGELWLEDLGHLSDSDFKLAIRMHRASAARFPTPADILKHYADIVESRRRNLVQLPEETRGAEEQEKINRDGIKAVRHALSEAKFKGKSDLI